MQEEKSSYLSAEWEHGSLKNDARALLILIGLLSGCVPHRAGTPALVPYTNSLLKATLKTRKWEIARSVCARPTLDLFNQAKSLRPLATNPQAVPCTPTHPPISSTIQSCDWWPEQPSAGKHHARQVSRLLSTPSGIITSRFGTALISAHRSSIPTLSALSWVITSLPPIHRSARVIAIPERTWNSRAIESFTAQTSLAVSTSPQASYLRLL